MISGELSREQIIEIADGAARQHGWDPDKCRLVYDEGNAEWRTFFPTPPPKLKGHEFQVVKYVRRELTPGADLRVIVDRHTGEVLDVIIAG